MRSRLNRIQDWVVLVKRAEYEPRRLAQLCEISLRQLERFTRDRFGQTLKHWVRSLRLTEAEVLLRNGTSAKSTAIELGYKQLSHFSRDFKKHAGLAPAAFATEAFLGSRAIRHSQNTHPVAFR